MKSNFIVLILFFEILFVNLLNAQVNTKQDYIASGYYQLVYEADIAHLEENDGLAYVKLQEAENTCNLINQFSYQDIEQYAMLLLKYKDFGKAIHYMEKLADEYGKMPYRILSVLQNDSILTNAFLTEYPAFFDSTFPVLIQKSEAFYTPERENLIAELMDMTKLDQEVRKDTALYHEKGKEIDAQNANRFFEIIKKYGFPNTRKYGADFQKTRQLNSGIFAMVLHISDRFDIEEMILQYVRDGECEPLLYGVVVDRKAIVTKKEEKCLYAAYTGTRDNQIADIEHLDERRMAIGMPTREMEKKRNELIELKFQANE